MASFSASSSTLSELLERVGDAPIEVNVHLTDSNLVASLKAEMAVLRAECERLQAYANRCEFRARCNSIVCQRVVDYARDHKLKIPRSLYEGLDAFE